MRVSFDLQGTLLTPDNSAVRPEIVRLANCYRSLGVPLAIVTAIHQDHLAAGTALVIDLLAKHGLTGLGEMLPAVYGGEVSMEAAKLLVIRRWEIAVHFDDLLSIVEHINSNGGTAVRV